MRGSSKILMALIAFVILAAPIAQAGNDLGLPTDKTSGANYQLVRFDGVIYKIFTEVPCDLYFQVVDDEHHRLTITPKVSGPVPFCEAVVQWGMFPPISLELVIGGTNSWLLGTETGYAEK